MQAGGGGGKKTTFTPSPRIDFAFPQEKSLFLELQSKKKDIIGTFEEYRTQYFFPWGSLLVDLNFVVEKIQWVSTVLGNLQSNTVKGM